MQLIFSRKDSHTTFTKNSDLPNKRADKNKRVWWQFFSFVTRQINGWKKIPKKKLREHARLHVIYFVQSRDSPSKEGRKLRTDFEWITLQQIYF